MERALGLSPVAFLVGTVLVYAASICAVPDSFIVVSEVRHIRGLQLNVSAPSTTDVIDPVVTTRAIAVDFDAKTESLYWTDYSKKAILGSRLANSTNSVIVLPGLATPDGLAVDWIGNHIYYTDSALSIIGMVSSDGYYALPLVQSQLDKPRAIVLDPSQGMMYWTDWGAAPKIERSYMSGEKRELLINTSLVYPNGLALDVSGGLLYWVDAKLDKLERSRLDGSQRKVLVRYNTQSSSIHPFALTFFDSWLYWTDWRLKGVVRVSLESLEARRIVSFADKPMGIAVYDANRKSGSNGCSSNNGECQQVCLAEGTGRRCDCSYGTLNDDGKTCTVSDSFVLYSDIDSVRAITFTPNDDREASHPVVTTEIPFGVDFAWRTRTIFWTEQQTRRLMKAAHNERAQPTVVVDSHLRRPVSVAYDWMGGNIFFADMGKGSIDVCRSDGSFCRSLIVTDLGEPTSLAVDPAGGYLYWTDQKAKYNRIERSFMNGDKRHVIVPSSVLGAPKGLTLDLAARKIYWVEHHSNKIGVADLDGSNRATLVSNRPLLEQPVHLAHYNGHLYITTEAKNNVLRCRDDGSNLTLFRRTRNTPEDIKVVHSSMQNGRRERMQSQQRGM
ncbi:low-density lipoprotein receptor-related protein 6-like isoform X2 [Corticium candelabrum]|uniref:low-density lipoprotein receptor-related protein 6-like isoform X2 n=1 Tax=Corticium candelabrum TaxID=121492 RepID=UPI002E257B43|nr:low-density lipoprotein receptor-related protein 6-like isoform X2 [Corticium candelabrum]